METSSELEFCILVWSTEQKKKVDEPFDLGGGYVIVCLEF